MCGKAEQLHRDVSSDQIDRRFVVPRLDGRIYLPSEEPARPGTLPHVAPLLTATESVLAKAIETAAGTAIRELFTQNPDRAS
jgi:hypothetical protein